MRMAIEYCEELCERIAILSLGSHSDEWYCDSRAPRYSHFSPSVCSKKWATKKKKARYMGLLKSWKNISSIVCQNGWQTCRGTKIIWKTKWKNKSITPPNVLQLLPVKTFDENYFPKWKLGRSIHVMPLPTIPRKTFERAWKIEIDANSSPTPIFLSSQLLHPSHRSLRWRKWLEIFRFTFG